MRDLGPATRPPSRGAGSRARWRGLPGRRPWLWVALLAVLLAAAGSWTASRALGPAAGKAAVVPAGPPRPVHADGLVVSLTFDGSESGYTLVRPLLRRYGLHATFYVTPDRIDAAHACCFSWAQAQQLYREGDEIGTTSADGEDLTVPSSPVPAQDYDHKRQEVCGARERLDQMGLDPRSFAYPGGAHDYQFPGMHRSLTDLVSSCGYLSGRLVGGLAATGPAVDPLPPPEPFAVRTPQETALGPLTLDALRQSVTDAARSGPGWLPLVFGAVCHAGDPDHDACMRTRRPVEDSVLAAFLGWLAAPGRPGGAPDHTAVLTVRAVMGAPVPVQPAPPPPATVVSLTFDDGDVTQRLAGRLLHDHGLHGTFYVNSGPIDARDPQHLSWSDVLRLHQDGNDIGGHTRDHVDLTGPTLSAADRRAQVCDDRRRLQQVGVDPENFAYPYGALDPAAEQVVRSCGYRSARSAGSVSPVGPVFAEALPPHDPFATLALDGPTGPADETAGPPLTLPYLQQAVTAAAANGGGWVQVVLHRVCASGAPDFAACMAGESPIEDTTFSAWLDWLRHGAPAGTTVRTVRQVVDRAP